MFIDPILPSDLGLNVCSENIHVKGSHTGEPDSEEKEDNSSKYFDPIQPPELGLDVCMQ